MTIYEPLKIMAHDHEDLDILLALLQDSMMPVVSVVYDAQMQTMTFLCNRFCWEVPEEDMNDKPLYYRVHAGLLFKNVKAVHEKHINQNDKSLILSFLMATVEKREDDYFVYLMFSDDACIRLTLSSIDCVLADIDEPWTTQSYPTHLEEAESLAI